MTKVQRYKVGYYTDEWGMSSNTPCLAPDDSGYAVESLLAENERLKHNLAVTEQTMREYQELAAKRLEEIAKYRDAPVVAELTQYGVYITMEGCGLQVGAKLIVKPGEEK